jgi:CHASE3 domain sensor protein
VKLKLENTLSNIRDAETAQRGYLLTQDSLFLEHYHDAQMAALESVGGARKLTHDNIVQQKNIDQLESLTQERFASLANTLSVQAASSDKSVKTERLLNGRRVMGEIRVLIAQMTSIEDDLLKQRENQRDKALQLTPVYALGILLFSLLIVIGCYILMARYSYQLIKAM